MKKIISIILFALFLTIIGAQTIFAENDRIEGSDRYSTAVEISNAGWISSEIVVLANGLSFPDALAGGPLAYFYDAPILLSKEKTLPSVTESEIERLEAKKVIILGGTAAISDNVEQHLRSLGLEIERINGDTRFETAELIAEKLPSSQAFLVNGLNFPDALSIAPYAARNGIPIVLTRENRIPDSTLNALQGKSKTIIIGGTTVVSEEVESQLTNPVRYSGDNRFETGKAIVQNLPLGNEVAYIATGMNFADALTGSVLAAKNNAPILLVKQNSIPSSTKSLLENYQTKYIFGGATAVSELVLREVKGELTTFHARGISIGDSLQTVTTLLGEPNRIDSSRINHEWYIYNKDYSEFLMVGIEEGKVVRLASNAKVWDSTNGINIGTSSKTVIEKLGGDYDNATYLMDDSYYVSFFYDEHKGDTVSLIELTDKNIEFYNYKSDSQVAASLEKQIFDLANATRVQIGLKPYIWDAKAANAARKHSQDMIERNYVAHTTPDGVSFTERMEKEGLELSGAAENIAAGYFDALSVHMGWMNSQGHRSNIISDLKYLGVGIAFGGDYQSYYTQNFYTPWK